MPKKRIPPTQQIDNEINELRYNLGEAVIPKDVLGKFMNMAMRRIVQEILENEVADFTGREYYKHAAPKQGYRNGYEPSTLRTAEGRLDILRPQVRDSEMPFESKTWPHLKKVGLPPLSSGMCRPSSRHLAIQTIRAIRMCPSITMEDFTALLLSARRCQIHITSLL